jgi:hypothetical protein
LIRDILLSPNENGYLLMALNYEKGYVGKFELRIESDERLISVEESESVFSSKYKSTIKGVWSNQTAGGCCSEFNFFKNPQ